MSNTIEPPPLDQQWEDLISFCIRLDRSNEDMDILPYGPPMCERVPGPARYGFSAFNKEGVPIGLPYMAWHGGNIPNARRCPNCNCLTFNSNLKLGDVTQCFGCRLEFQW